MAAAVIRGARCEVREARGKRQDAGCRNSMTAVQGSAMQLEQPNHLHSESESSKRRAHLSSSSSSCRATMVRKVRASCSIVRNEASRKPDLMEIRYFLVAIPQAGSVNPWSFVHLPVTGLTVLIIERDLFRLGSPGFCSASEAIVILLSLHNVRAHSTCVSIGQAYSTWL